MECHPHSHTVCSVVDHDSIHLRGDIVTNMYEQASFLWLFTCHFMFLYRTSIMINIQNKTSIHCIVTFYVVHKVYCILVSTRKFQRSHYIQIIQINKYTPGSIYHSSVFINNFNESSPRSMLWLHYLLNIHK